MKKRNPGKSLLAAVMAMMLVLVGGATLSRAQSTQDVFEEAKKAYYRGDIALAKAGLEQVLSKDPRHATARAYLSRINYQIKAGGDKGVNSLEAQMAALIVPTVDFQDATLGSVIEFLPKKAAELTDKKFEPSIIFKGPAEELESKKVSLKLTNVPMSEVLRYVGELTQMTFMYEKYAIVAVPLRDVPVAAPAPEKKEAPSLTTKGDGVDPFGQGGQGGTGGDTKNPFR